MFNRRFLNERGCETADLFLPGLYSAFARRQGQFSRGAELNFEATKDGDLMFRCFYTNNIDYTKDIDYAKCFSKEEMDNYEAPHEVLDLFISRLREFLDRLIPDQSERTR